MGKIKPNVVRGGTAIDLGNNLFLMKGRTHNQGGIDIGSNPRTGLEVENNEVMQVTPKGLKVFSAQPILGGISPAQYILGGANPNTVFAAQEKWKKANKIKDDGSKARFGKDKNPYHNGAVLNKEEVKPEDFSGITLTKGRAYNLDYINYINKKLIDAGISNKERAIFIGNMMEESGGDPFAKSKNGTYQGLFQWGDDRYRISEETDPYKEIDNQLNYFLTSVRDTTDKVSWTHGGSGSKYNSLKQAYETFNSDDLYNSHRAFSFGYVRPEGKEDSSNNRYKVVQQVFERLNKKYGGIHIKPSKRGTFTAAAKKHGMSVQGFASQVLANKSNYSSNMVKKAVFAKNSSKWNKKDFGGEVKNEKDMTFEYILGDNGNLYKFGGRTKCGGGLQVKTEPINTNFDKRSQDLLIKTQDLLSKVKNSDTPKNDSDKTSLYLNLAGNTLTALSNLSTIKSRRYPSFIPLRAENFDAKVNVSPQIAQIKESEAKGERDTIENTASSRVALGRRNLLRNLGSLQINSILSQKENIENSLLMRKIANRQDVSNKNISAYNAWKQGKFNFDNKNLEDISENTAAFIQNSVDAISGPEGYIASKERKIDNDIKLNRDLLGLRLAAIVNPNANPVLRKEIEQAVEEQSNLLRKRRNINIWR